MYIATLGLRPRVHIYLYRPAGRYKFVARRAACLSIYVVDHSA